MSDGERRLHAVSSAPEEPLASQGDGDDQQRKWVITTAALAVLLFVALGSLAYVAQERGELHRQLLETERQNQALREVLIERDSSLKAHRERLDDVRGHVGQLNELLNTPVDAAP